MARIKTIYSLRGIFTDLLEDSGVKNYMIPAYQRGYKWTSSDENSQVQVLLKDLYSAFDSQSPRYYLQFITLKEKEGEFEVIDGQQRLTTLTILFSVLMNFEEVFTDEIDFVLNKLNYQVRENFIKKYIYDDIGLILTSKNWPSFVSSQKDSSVDVNNQDVYFIYEATKAIHKFISQQIDPNKRKKFFEYISENVQLIVNPLEKAMNSEKIFINVNKGIKLKDEDLVKGLLVTRIPLEQQEKRLVTENEINEVRTNLGRQWDELAKWASRKDIRSYYKILDDNVKMGWIIHLAYPGVKGAKEINPLFTYLDSEYHKNGLKASEIFDKCRGVMLKLNDFYCEPELANLLGYVLHSNKNTTIFKIWDELSDCNTKADVLGKLKKEAVELLPLNSTNEIEELSYEESKGKIFNLFLMIDVAKFLPLSSNRHLMRYDFERIFFESWSIEHIFPQNPGDFELTELSPEDIALIKQLLPKDFKEVIVDDEELSEKVKLIYEKIKNCESACRILPAEIEYLDYLITKNAKDLHRLGNLALLDRSLNSGLSNHFFDTKRKLIVGKVSEGKFVPFHTYDVFSKLIIDGDTNLHSWTKDDIDKHEKYIKTQIATIVDYLKK